MDKEVALMQALISHNHGATFLLNCGTMSLRMGPGRALLELLVPPSLRVLYIDGDEVPASEMWREFERLSCAAPFLLRLGARTVQEANCLPPPSYTTTLRPSFAAFGSWSSLE